MQLSLALRLETAANGTHVKQQQNNFTHAQFLTNIILVSFKIAVRQILLLLDRDKQDFSSCFNAMLN